MATGTIKYTQLFINNGFVDCSGDEKLTVINPSTEEEVCQVHQANKEDVDRAVCAAANAFTQGSQWRKLSATKRGRVLEVLAGILERDAQQISNLITTEMGKPITESQDDVEFSVKILRYFSGWADKNAGQTIPADSEYFCFTKHEPVGVCALILPWNYPLPQLCQKLAPALACGCTVVVKPSEMSPLSALHFAALTKEAGFPPGVINIIPGDGKTGSTLAQHHLVNKIAFTGSSQTGKAVMQATVDNNMKRVSLELGNKSSLIVFSDVDVERAAMWAHESVMHNSGQNCSAASRVYVQSEIYDAFVNISKTMAENRFLGDPLEDFTQQGPVASKSQMDSVLEHIAKGKAEGAKLEAGGGRHGDKGYFIQPTVFSGVTDEMHIAKEEIFGPVQCILKFNTMEEVAERSNKGHSGLTSGIFTNNMATAMALSDKLQTGTVWINCYNIMPPQCPFGGMKGSGFGRELGEYALREYTEVKTVMAAWNL